MQRRIQFTTTFTHVICNLLWADISYTQNAKVKLMYKLHIILSYTSISKLLWVFKQEKKGIAITSVFSVSQIRLIASSASLLFLNIGDNWKLMSSKWWQLIILYSTLCKNDNTHQTHWKSLYNSTTQLQYNSPRLLENSSNINDS